MKISPEFKMAMAVLSAGVDKPMPEHQVRVFFDLLKDIPIPILNLAVKQALIEHDFHTIPPVGLLRRLAMDVMHGPQMTGDEAWGHVRKARGSFYLAEYDVRQWEAVESKIPEPARTIARNMGWRNLAEGDDDVLRSNFLKAFAAVAHEERRQKCLPEDVKREAARVRLELRRLAAQSVKGIE